MARKGTETKRKRTKANRTACWAVSIRRIMPFAVVKKHGKMTITRKGVQTINSFVSHMLSHIASEATALASRNDRSTLLSRDIQTACRLVIPGQLGKHSISQGVKAFAKFQSHQK